MAGFAGVDEAGRDHGRPRIISDLLLIRDDGGHPSETRHLLTMVTTAVGVAWGHALDYGR